MRGWLSFETIAVVVVVGQMAFLQGCRREVPQEEADTDAVETSVPECRDLLRDIRQSAEEGSPEQRERMRAAIEAQRNTLARIARTPATRPELARHCERLSNKAKP